MSTHFFCITCTLPQSNCICAIAPKLLFKGASILFHPRELERRNSSGRLLKRLGLVQAHTWHRLNTSLASTLDQHILLFPEASESTHHEPLAPNVQPLKVLLLDGTWQETQKMIKQSPWLNQLPKYSLKNHPSLYALRRNQRDNGLSTLESLAYYLGEQGHTHVQQELLQFFERFQVQYQNLQKTGQLK